MDYLILVLLFVAVVLMLVIHQDIITLGDTYNNLLRKLSPGLAEISQPMKGAITFSCLIFFAGIIGLMFTNDNRWLWNALGFALVPPLIQFVKSKLKKNKVKSSDNES